MPIETPPHSAPDMRRRVDELLASMTLAEKAMQLSAVMPQGLGVDDFDPSSAGPLLRDGIGQVSGLGLFGYHSPAKTAQFANATQRFLRDQTRLGIPAIFHNEALNGVVSPGFTVFPTAIALAATWDPEKVAEMADLIRQQMRAVGFQQALSPVMDVARDARWGRVHETYGEEPYLVTAMSVAFTSGLQRGGEEGVIATAKHFLGYAVTEGGQNMAGTVPANRELLEVYARPFDAAIHLAGLKSVMNSYSSVDGVPVGASHHVLTHILRDRLGFTGTVVSDYMTIDMLHTRQAVAENLDDAAVMALEAGLDIELPAVSGYGPRLAELVERRAITEEALDAAVRRVLTQKFEAGLFENPFVPEDPVRITQMAAGGVELATSLAAESVTLLKNEANLLPLSPRLKTIAVIGPHADRPSVGFPAYTYPRAVELLKVITSGGMGQMAGVDAATADSQVPEDLTRVLALDIDDYVRADYVAPSLAEAIRALAPDAEVRVASGCAVTGQTDVDALQAALATADGADVVILAVGGIGGWFAQSATEGEGSDTADIDLPPVQRELVAAVSSTGAPVVGVLFTGRPMGVSDSLPSFQALIHGYYGGQEGAKSVAGVLFGVTNPGGRLPYSMPRSSGQVPIHVGQHVGSGYRRTDKDQWRGYLDQPATPLFPFGHGLSYTQFQYSDLAVTESLDDDDTLAVEVTVTNTGSRGGDEVVQVYFADRAPGLTRPAQELMAFKRIGLENHHSARLRFDIEADQLAYLGENDTLRLDPGPVQIQVGSSSADIRLRGQVAIIGAPKLFARRSTFLSKTTVTDL